MQAEHDGRSLPPGGAGPERGEGTGSARATGSWGRASSVGPCAKIQTKSLTVHLVCVRAPTCVGNKKINKGRKRTEKRAERERERKKEKQKKEEKDMSQTERNSKVVKGNVWIEKSSDKERSGWIKSSRARKDEEEIKCLRQPCYMHYVIF